MAQENIRDLDEACRMKYLPTFRSAGLPAGRASMINCMTASYFRDNVVVDILLHYLTSYHCEIISKYWFGAQVIELTIRKQRMIKSVDGGGNVDAETKRQNKHLVLCPWYPREQLPIQGSVRWNLCRVQQ
jgi:hypothetical protein